MAGKVKTIPDGWHSVTPFLCIKDAARAISFIAKRSARRSWSAWRSRTGKLTM